MKFTRPLFLSLERRANGGLGKNVFLLGSILMAFVLQASGLIAAEPDVSDAELPRVPATPPEKAVSTFKVKQGFKIELVAAEPLVVDPIAICFDANSRMYVVEMRDYSERRDERLGRIKLLEDTDGDGRMDKATVFAEGLPWPTALTCYDGGLFVGSTPDVFYFKDTDGDGKADIKKRVFTGFGSSVQKLNVQQLFNSFTWALDGRIHGASGGNGGVVSSLAHPEAAAIDLRNSDFSFDPKTLQMRKENGGGQYGMSFDLAGRKFVCSNSSHIREVMYEERYLVPEMSFAMPSAALDIPVDGPAAEVYRISPDEPWRVIRTKWRVSGLVPGPVEGGGRASGYFTGATGLTIYRGDALGDDFEGNAFIGDAGSNLVHRKRILPNGVPFKAERPEDEQKIEFVASTDNWFRPVQLANAPDGALYICDMYREVIEHPWSLPPNLKQHLDLNSGNDRGRIYRVVPEGFKQPTLPKLEKASSSTLVEYLAHPNGWHRETAARLLCERQDASVVPELRELLRRTDSNEGEIFALSVLSAQRALRAEDALVGFESKNADVRECAIRFSETVALTPALLEGYEKMLGDPEARVRYQLTWSLSTRKEIDIAPYLVRLASKAEDSWERNAVLAVLSIDPARFFQAAKGELSQKFLEEASHTAGLKGERSAVNAALVYILRLQPLQKQLAPAASLIRGLQVSKPSLVEPALAQLGGLSKLAADILTDGERTSELETAVRVLAPDFFEGNAEKILSRLSPKSPPETQIRIFDALAVSAPKTAANGLTYWAQWTPSVRSAVLEEVVRQSRMHSALLKAMQKGVISPGELSPAQVIKLRASSKEILSYLDDLNSAKGQSSRAEVIRKYQSVLTMSGKSAKGKMIFTNLCATCHRLNGYGNSVGPDLESVRTSGKEAILLNILDPNREVPPRYASYEIETSSGDEFSGILGNESAAGYSLKQPNAQEIFIPRQKIKSIRGTGKSLMPEGLEAAIPPEEMANLIAYIMGE